MECAERRFGARQFFQISNVYFHVAKKIYEKSKAFDSSVSAMVIRHIDPLHFLRSDEGYQERLTTRLARYVMPTTITDAHSEGYDCTGVHNCTYSTVLYRVGNDHNTSLADSLVPPLAECWYDSECLYQSGRCL